MTIADEVKILLFSDDKPFSKITSKFLMQKGFNITNIEESKNINEVLKDFFDVIIINQSSLENQNIAIGNFSKNNNSNSFFIVVTDLNNLSTKHYDNKIKFLKKPLNLIELESLIKQHEKKPAFLKDDNYILNYLSQNFISGKRILFTVFEHINKELGLFYIENDYVVHVEFNDLFGEEAIEPILKIKNGLLSNFLDIETPVITTNIHLDSLLKNFSGTFLSENKKESDTKNKGFNEFDLESITSNKIIVEQKNIQSESKIIKTVEKKILIVDDDLLTLKIFSKFFDEKSFYSVNCSSAKEGMDALNKEKFNFVITDINIPDISGFSFLLWIKKNHPKTKVIMITAFSSEKISHFATINGSLTLFEKPVNLKKLYSFIEENMSDKDTISEIQNAGLYEFLNLLALSREEKVISVIDLNSEKQGLLYIRDGKIIFARFDNLIGLQAFYSLIDEKNLYFNEIEIPPPMEVNINSTIDTLIQARKIIKKEETIKSLEEEIKSFEPQKQINDDLPKNEPKQNKILIVDDDIISTKIISKFLKHNQYLTKTCDSAVEGEKILKLEPFDLVITDINMPKINGLEFLLWIKQYFPDIKVILMTAFSNETIRGFSNKKGAFYYFEKPINLKELINLIKIAFSSETIHKDISFEDFIKILSIMGGDKLVCITDVISGVNSYVYLRNDLIIHAESEHLKGKTAFKKIINAENCIFSDIPWKDPSEITLNYDINKLLEKFEERSKKEISHENIDSVIFDTPSNYPNLLEIVKKIRNETNLTKKFTIYEEGVVLELIIGKTTKLETIEIMKKYSKVNIHLGDNSQIFIYDDISLTIYFDDNNIVREIHFGKFYPGITSKGVKIDDQLKKGFEIYGNPNIFTVRGAVWNNISLFSSDSKFITSIRIRG